MIDNLVYCCGCKEDLERTRVTVCTSTLISSNYLNLPALMGFKTTGVYHVSISANLSKVSSVCDLLKYVK